jgi:valyl-tRNA synthetase
LQDYAPIIERLARVEESMDAPEDDEIKGAVQVVLGAATLAIPLAGVIDFEQEKARLSKELQKLDKELERFNKKLSNDKFLSSAPAEVVEEQRTKREAALLQQSKVQEALKRIENL